MCPTVGWQPARIANESVSATVRPSAAKPVANTSAISGRRAHKWKNSTCLVIKQICHKIKPLVKMINFENGKVFHCEEMKLSNAGRLIKNNSEKSL